VSYRAEAVELFSEDALEGIDRSEAWGEEEGVELFMI
jgi:hypothetical protein